MRYSGWRLVAGVALLSLMGWLLMVAGCDDDEAQGPPLVDQTPGNWARLLPGQATDPAYAPSGTPAEGLLAFASFRAAGAGDSLGGYNHIWVADVSGDSADLYQITSDEAYDFDPAWSPSGERLSFTRDDGIRRDVYWVDVSDIENPGAPIKVTDISLALSGASEGRWTMVGAEEQILYSDGSDIRRVAISGGSAAKVIPDPGDFSDPDCGGSFYEDLQPAPGPDELLAFVSRGRARVGTIHVRSTEAGGGPTEAQVWLEGCDTTVAVGSEAYFPHRPEGPYRVRGFKDQLGICDTLDQLVNVNPGTTEVDLSFAPTRGRVWVRSISSNPSEFPYFVDCENMGILARPAVVDNPLDSLIFTAIDCIEEGTHIISGAQGFAFDTAWVDISAGENAWVTLVYVDSAWGYYPHGGEGEFFWRFCPTGSICAESTCAEFDTSGNCLDSVCSLWDCESWWKNWASIDTLCGDLGAPGLRSTQWAFPPLKSPSQGGPEEIWLYDTGSDGFQRLSDMVSMTGGSVQRPVWDPTPGEERMAVITWMVDHWGVQVVDIARGAVTDIALPGQDGPFVCQRDAVSVGWCPTENKLAVAIGPCQGGSYPSELEIWTVELDDFGVQ